MLDPALVSVCSAKTGMLEPSLGLPNASHSLQQKAQRGPLLLHAQDPGALRSLASRRSSLCEPPMSSPILGTSTSMAATVLPSSFRRM